MNKKYIIFLLTLFYCAMVHAQVAPPDSLLQQLKHAKEDTNKVNLLRNIGASVAYKDPLMAIGYWKQGVALSKKLNYTVGLARNLINIGTGFAFLSKFDSSLVYAESAIVYCKIINDPERLALVYLNISDNYSGLGIYKKALLYADTARGYAEKTTNTDRLARIYSIIGSIYDDQKQYANALLFIHKSLDLFKKDSNNMMIAQTYDDIGYIYKETNKLDSSLMLHKMAIDIAEKEADFNNLATYYYNVAEIYFLKQQYGNAEQFATKSLQYAQQQENNIHLATAYTMLGSIYLKQEKFDAAIKAGNTAYGFSLKEAQLGWQKQTAVLLADAYTAVGDYKNANKFLNISSKINDSLQHQLYSNQVAELQSAFEVKEKDKAILLLNKDKELQQQKLEQQKLLLIGAAVIVLLALIGTWALLNRNKLKQHLKEVEIRNKIASDLHDDVGSTLSSIRMYSDIVKHQPNQTETAAALLDKISSNSKEMIENMSDIVWMIKPGNDDFKSIENRMLNFANEICVPAGINFEFNKDDISESIQMPMEQRRDIYLIFKEAINNAVKYSGCKNIRTGISQNDRTLQIHIEDDGDGFDTTTAKSGNGLSNMHKRAEANGGTLKIKSAPDEGTSVIQTYPLFKAL